MSKARKRFLTILIVLIVLSAAAYLTAGLLKDRSLKDTGRIVDLNERQDIAVGERVTFEVDPDDVKSAGGDLYFVRIMFDTKTNPHNYIIYPLSGYNKGLVSSQGNSGERITATVAATGDNDLEDIAAAQTKITSDSLDFMKKLYSSGEYKDMGYDEARITRAIEVLSDRISPAGVNALRNNITKYKFQAVDVSLFSTVMSVSLCAGILCIIVLIYALLSIRFKARFLVLGTVLAVICTIGVAAFIMRHDLSTMISVREYCPGLYMAKIDNDYKLDDMMERHPASESDYLNALSGELFFGIPMSVDISSFGCSAFSAKTNDGTHLFGRNFDLGNTDGTIIYTAPSEGYRSIGICDMRVINLAGSDAITEVTSLTGRAMSRAFPYITFDGMNEKGLGIGILSLDKNPSHPDTDKPDTYMLLAIRYILDRCATVDEAVAFLKSYDVHSMAVYNYHLFITDKSGHSVVAEWVDNEMSVIEADHVCNDYMTDPDVLKTDDRYQTLDNRLAECDGVLTVSEAMDLLKDVKQDYEETATQWSCVYDLDNFKVYVVSDMAWEKVYEVTPESFT
ncbi:Linear amide C-N hydrolases, choloylglycine hydrolase family [Ruminococcaceae bacterium YRB3002]|nr:Linear amide C-N hydrolases, choloylglycine hydrolase family [Ruminococcaceae bacterium YRB3002]